MKTLITIFTVFVLLTAVFFIYMETGVLTAIAIGALTICVLYLMEKDGAKEIELEEEIEGYDPKTSNPNWKI